MHFGETSSNFNHKVNVKTLNKAEITQLEK